MRYEISFLYGSTMAYAVEPVSVLVYDQLDEGCTYVYKQTSSDLCNVCVAYLLIPSIELALVSRRIRFYTIQLSHDHSYPTIKCLLCSYWHLAAGGLIQLSHDHSYPTTSTNRALLIPSLELTLQKFGKRITFYTTKHYKYPTTIVLWHPLCYTFIRTDT